MTATDFVTPVPPLVPGNNSFDSSEHILRGWTNDTVRTVPVHSLGDAETAGIVVTPTDLSPDQTSNCPEARNITLSRARSWQGVTIFYKATVICRGPPSPFRCCA